MDPRPVPALVHRQRHKALARHDRNVARQDAGPPDVRHGPNKATPQPKGHEIMSKEDRPSAAGVRHSVDDATYPAGRGEPTAS